MRKRNITKTADTVFWYLIYFMPALCYLFLFWNKGETTITFEQVFSQFGFGIDGGNIIYNTLQQIFGSNGTLPLFNSNGLLMLVSWFASVMIIHLCIDALLWLVRWAHKVLSDSSKG